VQFRIVRHDVIDSTSERAFASIERGTARHGDVHVARGQTNGRGRLGRAWFSPTDGGVYASLVLLPPPPAWNPIALTMAVGLAVRDAARAVGADEARLKWPNDVVVRGAKLAGVLVETRGLDPERPHYVVGVGMNVRATGFPAALENEREVTNLARLGLSTTVDEALRALLDALSSRVTSIAGDPESIADDYVEASGLAAASIAVRFGSADVCGRLIELSVERGLLLCREDERCGDEVRVPLELVREIRMQ
jgi:BirA family biotin operon repressor/biotin-[acetyl-CoA-carboxylase] ligase